MHRLLSPLHSGICVVCCVFPLVSLPCFSVLGWWVGLKLSWGIHAHRHAPEEASSSQAPSPLQSCIPSLLLLTPFRFPSHCPPDDHKASCFRFTISVSSISNSRVGWCCRVPLKFWGVREGDYFVGSRAPQTQGRKEERKRARKSEISISMDLFRWSHQKLTLRFALDCDPRFSMAALRY